MSNDRTQNEGFIKAMIRFDQSFYFGSVHESILNYDGERKIFDELSDFLKDKVSRENNVDINFVVNCAYFEEIVEFESVKNIEIKKLVTQNVQKKILMDKLELGNSEDLNIMNSSEARVKFVELANGQRGAPESKMLEIQRFIGGGLICNSIEHIGDLTHRISQSVYVDHDSIECALNDIDSKINNGIRRLGNVDVFKRQLEESLLDSFNYKLEQDELGCITTFKEYRDKALSLLQEYSELHKALPVYNEFQLHARNAAVNLGLLNFEESFKDLMVLNKIIENQDFVLVASSYDSNYEDNLESSGKLTIKSPTPKSGLEKVNKLR